MKCREIRQFIYTYPELSDSDKLLLEDHVVDCESCRALLTGMRQSRVWIERAASFSPEPVHAAKLTGNIIRSITEQRAHYPQSRSWQDNPVFRLVMATCSFVLIVVFAAQQRVPDTPYKPAGGRSVVLLNTSTMLRELREQTSRKDESDSWYVCATQEYCNLAIVQKIKTRNLQ